MTTIHGLTLIEMETIRMKVKFYIDEDLGIDHRDSGPWRSYSISAGGNTIEELIEDATISETDQDGGELNFYSIDDASNEVGNVAMTLLYNLIEGKNK